MEKRENEREGEREKRGVCGVSDNCTKYAIGTGSWLCRYVTVSCDSSVAVTESCETLLSPHRSRLKMPLRERFCSPRAVQARSVHARAAVVLQN